MEYATALLLAETAFENYASLSPEISRSRSTRCWRASMPRAQARPLAGAAGAPMLDEMRKRAQERLLLAQVGREIQANLRHMEQVLDAFFRDNAKRGELATLGKDSQQIRGALRILGLDDAERLLELCQQQIETYADPEAPVSNEDLELLAESLSGLGFYIEAVEQQRPDRERLIAPLLAKRLGEAPRAVEADAGDTVEAAVAELRARFPSSSPKSHARRPTPRRARACSRSSTDLRDDAELIGDAGSRRAGRARRWRELDAGGTADARGRRRRDAPTTARARAGDLRGNAAAARDRCQRVSIASCSKSTSPRPREVLDTVAASIARSSTDNPGDREALRTVRRRFHTLKGSGRMVGLAELGEIAFEVEKIHNRLLEEERSVTPAVLAMIDVARTQLPRLGRCADAAPGASSRTRAAARGDRRRRGRACRRAANPRRRPHRRHRRSLSPVRLPGLPAAALSAHRRSRGPRRDGARACRAASSDSRFDRIGSGGRCR